MKLTKTKLKQIIKEELGKVLKEFGPSKFGGSEWATPDDTGPDALQRELYKTTEKLNYFIDGLTGGSINVADLLSTSRPAPGAPGAETHARYRALVDDFEQLQKEWQTVNADLSGLEFEAVKNAYVEMEDTHGKLLSTIERMRN